MSNNIFSIWRYLGKQTPFIVRRNNWQHLSYKVTRVVPYKQYGSAFGIELRDGKAVDGDNEEPINCCGCGNWELIEDLVEDVDNQVWNCLDDDNNITFGKYKGKNIKELKELDPDYFKWAMLNVGGLRLLAFSRRHGATRKELLNIKKQIKSLLPFNSDDWIKLNLPCCFDDILDDLKFIVYLKEITIEEAAKEITNLFSSLDK